MKKFLTPKEAADYLKISEEELSKIVDKGKIPSYKIGGVYTRFSVDELDSYSDKAFSKVGTGGSRPYIDNIKDFFYFNDFYIYAFFMIAGILYFIFK